MAKEDTDGLSAIDKLYAKYKKTENIFEAPKSLEDIDPTVGRLKNPILSFDRYLGGAPAYGKLTTYSGFNSTGKCLGYGTKVLMYDGSVKEVQNIKQGEQLMGVDSKPRNVLSTTTGVEQMYWVRQKTGDDYRVNESHILSLKKHKYERYSRYTTDGKRYIDKSKKLHESTDEVVNINILELITKFTKKQIKSTFKGYMSEVINFEKNYNLNIPPYLLGMWLADGTSSKPEITNIDEEVIEYIYNFAKLNGQKVTVCSEENKTNRYNIVTERGKDNPFLQNLQGYNLINNKHIPDSYKLSSVQERLELLAGIIDGDGYKDRVSYEIIQKNTRLAEDIKFLANSLGFRCTVRKKKGTIKSTGFEGEYNTCRIFGDVYKIPVKIPRKKINIEERNRSTKLTSIEIEKDTVDNYYGFEIDGDKLFLLGDFTVTHNTSLALAMAGANPDKVVGFVDAEMNWDEASYIWVDKYFGIEKERIHVLQPTYLEEGAEMVEDLCNAVDIVIYDGFDSIAPKAEYQATMEEQQMGLQARAYKKFFRRSMGKIYKSKAALIVTNHLYENIGNVFEPFKEPGGRSIHDFASQKLYLTRSNVKDKSGKTSGQDVNVTVNKDKLTGNRGAKFSIPYDNKLGFNIELDILNNAVELGVVIQKGAFFSYDGTTIGQGKEKASSTLKDNPELTAEIVGLCRNLF